MSSTPNTTATAAAPATAPTTANPWLRGPPAQIQAARAAASTTAPAAQQQQVQRAQQQSMPLPPLPPPVQVQRPKVARTHHHLSHEEAQVHAYQLSAAQQMALMAAQCGMDLPSYQIQCTINYGIDPRILTMVPEPGTRLDGTEPLLGLTLVKDDQAYTHVELLTRYPHIAAINLSPCDVEPRKAAYFLVTCHERQVHESIKYGYWTIPSEGAAALNRVFAEYHGVGPVYFLMASTDAIAFSGICQMVGPASQVSEGAIPVAEAEGSSETAAPAPSQYRIPVRWWFVKNIPFSHMQHVTLRPANKEAEEQRRAHGGLQPMKQQDGNRALGIFARYIPAISVLMDFKHYDEAEAKGIVAESGEASIRAAQRQQQRGSYQYQQQSHGHSHSYRQNHPRSYNNYNQQAAPQLNAQNFPTPAQAANKAPVSPSASSMAEPQQAQAQPPPAQTGQPGQQEGGHAPRPARAQGGFRSHRNQQQGGARDSGPARRLVTADEERVTLPTKYVFEPVVKEKQKDRRRRNKLAQEPMENAEYVEYGEGEAQPEGEVQENAEGNGDAEGDEVNEE